MTTRIGFALALVLVLAACASRSPPPQTPQQRRLAQKQQIAQLERQISRDERVLGIQRRTEQGGAQVPAAAEAATPSSSEEALPTLSPVAPPGEPLDGTPPGVSSPRVETEAPACERFCRSAASICDASHRICAIADQMSDDWARGRCQVAGLSCQNAQRETDSRCGGC